MIEYYMCINVMFKFNIDSTQLYMKDYIFHLVCMQIFMSYDLMHWTLWNGYFSPAKWSVFRVQSPKYCALWCSATTSQQAWPALLLLVSAHSAALLSHSWLLLSASYWFLGSLCAVSSVRYSQLLNIQWVAAQFYTITAPERTSTK